MHPAGRGGPSLILSCSETKQCAPGELHPGGKILPSLRLDGTAPEPTLGGSVDPTQNAPSTLPAERRSEPLIHNALTSTALGDALDGEKSDPKAIVRKLHVNWGRASSAEVGGRADGLIPLADDVVLEREICRAFDAAPAIPVSGPPRRPPSMRRPKWAFCFRTNLLPCVLLTFPPAIPSLRPSGRRIRERYRAPFAPRGLRFLGNPE